MSLLLPMRTLRRINLHFAAPSVCKSNKTIQSLFFFNSKIHYSLSSSQNIEGDFFKVLFLFVPQ